MDMYGGRKGVSEAWGERERGRKEGSNEGRRGGREGKGGTGREEGAQDIRQLAAPRPANPGLVSGPRQAEYSRRAPRSPH